MRPRHLLTLGILAALFKLPVSADTVISSPAGQWVSGWTANNSGEYWDHQSFDGTSCNIGFVLTGGSGPCGNLVGTMPLAGSPGVIPFLAANASGSTAVRDISFSPTVADHSVTLEIEIAGWAGFNEFGWYSGGALYKLFQGSDGPILNTSFSPTGNFGFYLHTKNDKYVFSESSLASVGGFNNYDRYKQHFTLFRESPTGSAGATADIYWIGAEDVKFSNGSDIDFNDVLVKITATPVPEPGSVLLLAASLAGLTLARRRRNSVR